MGVQKSVLVVDDSILSRSLICLNITRKNPDWKLVQAASGAEALDSLKAQSFDFYILDFNMPGMDGLELAKEIKRVHKNASIALCTANIQTAIQNKAQSMGVTFMNKPVAEQDLFGFLSESVAG